MCHGACLGRARSPSRVERRGAAWCVPGLVLFGRRYLCAYIHIYTYTNTQIHTYTHIHIYTYTHREREREREREMSIYTCTYTYNIYIYIYIYHTHTCLVVLGNYQGFFFKHGFQIRRHPTFLYGFRPSCLLWFRCCRTHCLFNCLFLFNSLFLIVPYYGFRCRRKHFFLGFPYSAPPSKVPGEPEGYRTRSSYFPTHNLIINEHAISI